MANAPIPPSRLLHHVEDALLVLGPDLVIRDIANAGAQTLANVAGQGHSLVGRSVAEAIAPLFAPFERPEFIANLQSALDPSEDGVSRHTIEGAAPAAVRAAGLTPFYDVTIRRYLDDNGALLSVSIRDVSDHLRLRRALSLSREERDLAMAVLRADPGAMYDYLRASLETLTLIQSLQRMSARTPDTFRAKLRRIASELQQIGNGAEALGIDAIAQSTRDVIADLIRTADLDAPSGDVFLPVAAALNNVFRQLLATCHNMELREASLLPAEPSDIGPAASPEAAWHASISVRLAERIEKVAQERGCRASLSVAGLELLPPTFHRGIEPMLLQLVNSAISHGIELPAGREAANKPPIGYISIVCTQQAQGGYEIIVSDDGHGLDIEEIRRVSSDEAGAGGVDIPFLQDLAMRMGGTIGVSTSKGRYTRLRIQLPNESGA